jgi:hypothetical protein
VAGLPAVDESLLVRTYFDDVARQENLEAALAENQNGFRVYVTVVDDEAFAGAPWEQLRYIAQASRQHAFVLFVIDREAMDDDTHPIQVVDLSGLERPPFRCAASQLWSVDNNLNLDNMEWEEFATSVDGARVYRGFD